MDKYALEFEIFMKEYEKLKDEQLSRIGFRDNLIYVTLTVFGAIASFALSDPSNYFGLLILPWVCIILGWTYLVNDQKISAIGHYIRIELRNRIQPEDGKTTKSSLFGWEFEHRKDSHRNRRKLVQVIVDELTFVVSGVIGLITFSFLTSLSNGWITILVFLELLLLLALGIEILIYSTAYKR